MEFAAQGGDWECERSACLDVGREDNRDEAPGGVQYGTARGAGLDRDVRVTDIVDGSRYTDASAETAAPDRIVLIDAVAFDGDPPACGVAHDGDRLPLMRVVGELERFGRHALVGA